MHTCLFTKKIINESGGKNENPNAPDKDGKTPIHEAAFRGHKDIVIFLTPLTDYPNAPNKVEKLQFIGQH